MYLKSLEMVGFKSFASRTRLDFDAGFTAIVGPNGCGKSNISDAIRWVLGETSARALRGGAMTDVIFNGTDSQKPTAMAEVSLTLAECEKALETEFNEVTVTRRVFRSGEGQYFINKTPCRLRDIQRLFMDTGMGTGAYSHMEQGRIDQILSARPGDRREVFEEASGITKFKTDKAEALRKLEHTDANLLRAGDLLREIKRQIISLQRHAGKARRFKELQERARALEIFLVREKMAVIDRDVAIQQERLAQAQDESEKARHAVDEAEQQADRIRHEFTAAESAIQAAMEAEAAARGEQARAEELIRHNQAMVEELERHSQKDRLESEEAQQNVQTHRETVSQLDRQIADLETHCAAAREQLSQAQLRMSAHEKDTEALRRMLQDLRNEAIRADGTQSRLRNDLIALEAKERNDIIRRERLAAEQADLTRSIETQEARRQHTDQICAAARADVDQRAARIEELIALRKERALRLIDLRRQLAEARAQTAKMDGQISALEKTVAMAEGFPKGARLLLDEDNPLRIANGAVLGTLVSQLTMPADIRPAVEAVLRAYLDAVVVRTTDDAMQALRALETRADGSARLLVADVMDRPVPTQGPGRRLADIVHAPENLRPLVYEILANARIVNSLDEIPQPPPPGAVFATPTGALVRDPGCFEYWAPGEQQANPLARQQTLENLRKEIQALHQRVQALESAEAALIADDEAFESQIEQARAELDAARSNASEQLGQKQVLDRQAEELRHRLQTVRDEVSLLVTPPTDRRSELAAEIENLRGRLADINAQVAARTDELRRMEEQRDALSSEVTEARVSQSERNQQLENARRRQAELRQHIQGLEKLIGDRQEGLRLSAARVAQLNEGIQTARDRIEPLALETVRRAEALAVARHSREEKTAALNTCEREARERRQSLDQLRALLSGLEGQITEGRIRREGLIERIQRDYHIGAEEILAAPEPPWEEGGPMVPEELERNVAELRAKMEAMGPVNLVAIEELQELEERHAFQAQQQEDLTKAKQNLQELIQKINATTTEMFTRTFEQVNQHFQALFVKLFGGGQAYLKLVDEGDVLESGIDIVARPPGKKLQTVSLLSGGERTMTAVALLFALYTVKPSPFCVLDELDAPLDEANIKRFITMLEDFHHKSQFIIITHNKTTMEAADVLYGVTMEKKGISRTVSVKFSPRGEKAAESTDGGAPTEPPADDHPAADVTVSETAPDIAPTPDEENHENHPIEPSPVQA